MKSNRQFLFVVLPACILLTMYSCHGSHETASDNSDKKLLDSLIRQSNLVNIQELPVTSSIDLTGKVSVDENRSARIFPLAGGIVINVAVEVGDYVQKDQLLATIKSPELIDAQKDYKNDEAEVLNQEKNVEAAKALYKSGLMSEKEYILTQNQLQIAKNNLQKSKELLNIYHQGTKPDEFNIYAPVSGYVIEKNISPNTQFQGSQSQSLFTVSDLNEIYVDANVYETDINKVHMNDSVYITTLAYPGKIFRGKISKILNVLDPTTKTMKVRAKLDNNIYLKPEMFAQISILYESGEIMKAIPKTAVVFDNSINYLVIQSADSAIVKKIDVRSTNSIYAYFEGDVSKKDKVSTKDALLIYNAIND
jgi:cobalt-zinc-cadmium efflux system membrane fusion protein